MLHLDIPDVIAVQYAAFAQRHQFALKVVEHLLEADGVSLKVAFVDSRGNQTPVPVALKNMTPSDATLQSVLVAIQIFALGADMGRLSGVADDQGHRLISCLETFLGEETTREFLSEVGFAPDMRARAAR